MESSEQKLELSVAKSDIAEDLSSSVEGSYIAERKRNIEYLDLQTEKSLKTIREQLSDQTTSSTSNDRSEKDRSVDSSDSGKNKDDDPPPGEENFESHSFNNEFSELYSEDRNDSPSKLKRSIEEANFNNPENQYLTLDEIEERKKAKMCGSITPTCKNTIRYMIKYNSKTL